MQHGDSYASRHPPQHAPGGALNLPRHPAGSAVFESIEGEPRICANASLYPPATIAAGSATHIFSCASLLGWSEGHQFSEQDHA